MKKLLFFVLAISMILMLVACGENENPTDTSSLASSENSAESSEQENTPSSEEPDVADNVVFKNNVDRARACAACGIIENFFH